MSKKQMLRKYLARIKNICYNRYARTSLGFRETARKYNLTLQLESSAANMKIQSMILHKIYSKPFKQRKMESMAHEIRMSKSSFQHAY